MGQVSGLSSLWNVQFHMQKSFSSVNLVFPYLQNEGLSMTLEHHFFLRINPQSAALSPVLESAARIPCVGGASSIAGLTSLGKMYN